MTKKKIEACMKCKYIFHRFCINKSCKDCEMNDKERDVCKCGTIAPHQECPYYEPAEEVNDGKESMDMPEM